MTVIYGERVLLPTGIARSTVLRCDRGLIVEASPTSVDEVPDVAAAWILPGLVDIHVHGGGGGAFDGSLESARTAAQHHIARGSTTLLASLMSAPVPDLLTSLNDLVVLVDEGLISGIHLEGPFLAEARRGAHARENLLAPDVTIVDELVAAGRGHVRQVTVAPELPGADAVIARLVELGIVAAIGHTDCSFEQARAAVEAGASLATHLFNGMRPVHHRDPGPVAACLASPDVVCEVIGDAVHLADDTVRTLFEILGPRRIALVTDAMAAAGMGDGEHWLGAQRVDVRFGVARAADSGALAGGTTSLLDIVLRAARRSGVPIADAVTAATSTPAAAAGLDSVAGAIAPGRPADLVLLDDDFALAAVLRAGRWVPGAEPAHRD